MKKVVFCTIALFITSAASISAQTVRDVRHVKTTALSLYEKYISSVSVLHNGGKYTGDDFMSLFIESGDTVYNDILPANQPQITTAYSYYLTYDSIIKYSNFDYNGFRFSAPQKKGGKWYIDCYFTRTVKFATRDSVYNIYPAWSFNYTMKIVMDDHIAVVRERDGVKEYDPDSLFANPRILSITVDPPLENYFILVNQESIPLRWHGEVVRNYDKDCDCWMMDASKDKISDIKYDGDNLFMQLNYIKDEKHPNFYTFSLDKMNLGGIALAVAPYGLGNRGDHRFVDIKEWNNSAKATLFYGIQLSNTLTTSLFFNMGVDAVYNTYNYSGLYQCDYYSTDIDGDDYLRKVRVTLNKETINEMSFTVPLTLNYVNSIYQNNNKQLLLYLKAGAYGGVRFLSAAYVDMSSRYTGLYSQYFNTEFDHYYDYGNYEMNQDNISNYNKGSVNMFDYGIDAGVGLWYALNRQYILGFGIDFRKSFVPVLKYESYEYLTTDFNHYESMLQTSNQGSSNLFFSISLIKLLSR